jgi:spore coat protein U-like protein
MKRGHAFLVLMLLVFGGRFAAAASCTISATAIAFGNYSGTAVSVTGTLTVQCNKNDAYDIALNAGMASGATVTNRSLTGPASSLLHYGLYSNASDTANWGNTSGTGWVTGTGTGSAQTITVYAQIPANQYPEPGTYTDTITATISGSKFATVTTSFSVTATVQAACSLSATNLAFGTYSGSLINSTSTVSVTCTNTTNYNVGLNGGTATGATVTNRSMTGPASSLLAYKLLSNAARTINWGNTVGSDTVAGTGSGATQMLTVYGQLPANQFVQPGSYEDTITATITY